MNDTAVDVTWAEGRGFVAVVPGQRAPIVALSLKGIHQRIALLGNGNSMYLRLDDKAQAEVNRRRVKV
jgi:hypothetical protein